MKQIGVLIGLLCLSSLAFSQPTYQENLSELLKIQGVSDKMHQFVVTALPPKEELAQKMDQEYADRLIVAMMDTLEALMLVEIAEVVKGKYTESQIEQAVLAEKSSGEEGYFLDMPSFLFGKIEEVGKGMGKRLSQEMVEGLIQGVHNEIQAGRNEKFSQEYKACKQAKKGKFVSDWLGENVIFDLKEGKIIELHKPGQVRMEFVWLSKCRFSIQPEEKENLEPEEDLGALVFHIYECEKESFQFLAKFEKKEMIFLGEMKKTE